jgi:acylphosphatase
MADRCRVHVLVKGRVQGVGYRAFTERVAREAGVSGYSRNLPDGDVELEAEGERASLERLIQRLREGPPLARVEDLQVRWTSYRGEYNRFVVKS